MAQLGTLMVVLSIAWLASPPVAAQKPASSATATRPAARTWTPPRTPWGDPDLQGQWNSQTSTPLQRPVEGDLANRESLSEEEAEALEEANRRSFDDAPRAGDPGTYNAFWRDSGKALTRTSLIVDPSDGRIPPLTPEAKKRLDAERVERSRRGPSDSPDSYEDLSLWTRCISRGWNGIGSWYSSNYQIFQAPGYVVILQELIPTNFDPRTNFQGSRDTLHLIERYTRVDENTIDYQFTIDDPKTFTRNWTVARPMTRITDRISMFEYACHEGNYAMFGILGGARAKDKAR
jgi:hypothetical protein